MEQPLRPPEERYVDAATIAARVFNDLVSKRWVLMHCPRVQLSPQKVVFLESRVRAWLAARSSEGAA